MCQENNSHIDTRPAEWMESTGKRLWNEEIKMGFRYSRNEHGNVSRLLAFRRYSHEFRIVIVLTWAGWTNWAKKIVPLNGEFITICNLIGQNVRKTLTRSCLRKWAFLRDKINSNKCVCVWSSVIKATNVPRQFYKMIFCRIVGYAPVSIKKYTVCII